MNRRTTLKLLSALPLVAAAPSISFAKDKVSKEPPKTKDSSQTKASKKDDKLIDEKDTLAKAMQYRHDASKAPAMRTNKKAFCYNCSKYNKCMDGDTGCKPLDAKALKTADSAPCQIFQKKNVARNGWCLSWQAIG